ncbi:MAG: DUF393 domain-containing protein [Cellvibrionaceae bacterium]|nr:DUF393 domain-containing protein [Cellvibrionaceae bacterium]
MISVYYDGKCGLCNKEINYYRRIAPAGVFAWRDVHQAEAELAALDISVVQALELLHSRDASGRIHVGVDSFILIWQQLRGWRYLAVLVGLPLIKPLTDAAYRWFARRRFQRLDHCGL